MNNRNYFWLSCLAMLVSLSGLFLGVTRVIQQIRKDKKGHELVQGTEANFTLPSPTDLMVTYDAWKASQTNVQERIYILENKISSTSANGRWIFYLKPQKGEGGITIMEDQLASREYMTDAKYFYWRSDMPRVYLPLPPIPKMEKADRSGKSGM